MSIVEVELKKTKMKQEGESESARSTFADLSLTSAVRLHTEGSDSGHLQDKSNYALLHTSRAETRLHMPSPKLARTSCATSEVMIVRKGLCVYLPVSFLYTTPSHGASTKAL